MPTVADPPVTSGWLCPRCGRCFRGRPAALICMYGHWPQADAE